MTRVLIPRAGGAKVVATTDFECFRGPVITDYLRCGWTVAAVGCTLAVSIAAGKGSLKGLFINNDSSDTSVTCLAVCDQTFIYATLGRDCCCRPDAFTFTTNLTGCTPTDSIQIGTATTDACMVTAVTTTPLQAQTTVGAGSVFPDCPACCALFMRSGDGEISVFHDNVACTSHTPPFRAWGAPLPRTESFRDEYKINKFIKGISGCSCTNMLDEDWSRWNNTTFAQMVPERGSNPISFSDACCYVSLVGTGSNDNGGAIYNLSSTLSCMWVMRVQVDFFSFSQGGCTGNQEIFFGLQKQLKTCCCGINLACGASISHTGFNVIGDNTNDLFQSNSGCSDWRGNGTGSLSQACRCLEFYEWKKAGSGCCVTYQGFTCASYCMTACGFCCPVTQSSTSGHNCTYDSIYFGNWSQANTSSVIQLRFHDIRIKCGVSTF